MAKASDKRVELNVDTVKKDFECAAFACSFKLLLRPFQEHCMTK
jgi:hypothetical protein